MSRLHNEMFGETLSSATYRAHVTADHQAHVLGEGVHEIHQRGSGVRITAHHETLRSEGQI